MRKRCLLCKELHEYTLSCGILHESSIPMRTVIPLHIVITVISRVPRDAQRDTQISGEQREE
jgi:hypothetical protein